MKKTKKTENMNRIFGAILFAAALIWPAAAHGQEGDQAKARMYFTLGKQLYAQKKYDQALAALNEALKHWKHRTIHFNIALTHARMGDKIAAARHTKIFLKKAPPGERTLPPILKRMLKETAVLRVKSLDPRGEILVDGKPVGTGRVEMIVLPGVKNVEIRLGGRTVARTKVVLPGGTERTWEQKPVVVPPRPRPEPRPRPGPRPGPGPEPAPAKKGRGRLHWAYFVVAAGVAVTAAAVATATGTKALQINDDYKKGGRVDTDLRDRGKMYQNITNGMWAVTAGAAVAATVLAIFTRWRRPEKASRVSAAPMLGPGTAGLSLTWKR